MSGFLGRGFNSPRLHHTAIVCRPQPSPRKKCVGNGDRRIFRVRAKHAGGFSKKCPCPRFPRSSAQSKRGILRGFPSTWQDRRGRTDGDRRIFRERSSHAGGFSQKMRLSPVSTCVTPLISSSSLGKPKLSAGLEGGPRIGWKPATKPRSTVRPRQRWRWQSALEGLR